MSFKHFLMDENAMLRKKLEDLQQELLELQRDTCEEYHLHEHSVLETVKENSNEV